MSYCYDYPRPMVTVDILVLHPGVQDPQEVLLIKRGNPPFEGHWAFPGGFCEMEETLEDAAMRELQEETNIKAVRFQQFRTISTVDRDPRGRTITTVFYTGLHKSEVALRAADDARDARWFALTDLPPMAFDHDEIMEQFIRFLHHKPS